MECLETELSNPNTLPSTKDALATVLREYSNARKSFASDQPILCQATSNHSQPFHQQVSEGMQFDP